MDSVNFRAYKAGTTWYVQDTISGNLIARFSSRSSLDKFLSIYVGKSRARASRVCDM